ncbi:MAG: hypothetical protein HQ518_28655 [Rhodopirellula sp.]|nr:hypothetical protein [Rhodopirellula sp.]
MSNKRTRAAKGAERRRPDPLVRKIPNKEAVWLEGPVPTGFWTSTENQRTYLLWLGQRLGFRQLADYYRIKTSDFKANRGSGALLHCWGSSSVTAVMQTFPEHEWQEWLFVSCPRSFWADRKNHRRYMKWLGEQCHVNQPDDWYRITNRDFREHKGGAFLLHYDSTISEAVKAYLPNRNWNEWQFGKTPKGFWEYRANRVRYMKWLGKRLGCKKLDDWYGVTRKEFEQNFGNQLMKHYNGSPLAAAMDCFSNHDWLEWKFARVPVGFWKKKANRERYFDWLGKTLKIRRPEDWKQVRRADLKDNFGGGLLAMYRSVETLLAKSGLTKAVTSGTRR